MDVKVDGWAPTEDEIASLTAPPKSDRHTLTVRLTRDEFVQIKRGATRERRSSAAFLVMAGLDRAREGR